MSRFIALILIATACLPASAATSTFAWTNQWSGGGQAAITITNNGTTAISGWTLAFDWAGDITSLWNGVIQSHAGQHYVIVNADYNANIAVGGSVVVGCVANLSTAGVEPSNITFNGTSVGGGTALAVSTTSLPAAGAGIAYSQNLAASGGTAPYSWSLLSGTLPGGLSLSSAGVINGTPSATGTSNFTVQVTDAASATANKALSITVATLPSLAINDVSITLQPPGTGGTNSYFSTSGNQIVDSAGSPVRITGINWFGFETSNRVLHGLWTRNYQQALDQIKQLGFNTLRIPFSNAMLQAGAATNSINFQQNPDLQGLTPLQCLDKIVAYCGQIGLRIFLDRHSANADGYMNEDVWFIPGDSYFTEQRWIDDWVMLATRYADNPTVIGADLFNEPKKTATWGNSSPATDWNKAAERCGNAIHAANPNWLIIVEGVEKFNGDSYWWGGNLMGAAGFPVVLNTPHKLVYSMHDYTASVFNQTWFSAPDYPNNLDTVWDTHFGYLYHNNTAPLLLGEFGSRLATTVDQQWMDKLTDYIDGDFDLNGTNDLAAGKKGMSFTYWCFNPNSGDTGGLLNDDWTTVNQTRLSYLAASLGPMLGTGTTGPAAQTMSFTITLSQASASAVTVNWATADGTATAGGDYTAASGTATFAAGETSKTISVSIPAHTASGPEQFTVQLSGAIGATISDASGIGTIICNDGSAHGKTPTGSYSYAEVMQKSLAFYSAQRSGHLPDGFRISWRGDAAVNDGADVGRDLSGGWFDAGDHVKFNFPMAGSATMLAWSGIEYPAAFNETGQMPYLLDELKFVCDYFLKCHVTDANGDTLEYYGQVGNGGTDHGYWGPAEVMTMSRPSYKVTRTAPGSDLCGETAASLAAASILFRPSNPTYADTLLANARKLYQFADTYRGKYSDAITDAAAYYNSWSGYQDDLMWGALWMYRATNESAYLTKAQTLFSQIFAGDPASQNYPQLKWTHAWDDKTYGALVLLSELTTNTAYRTEAERWLDYWTVGRSGQRITYTPGGLAWLDTWGSLRYAANTAFLALVYSDRVRDYSNRYRNFAISQVNYALGSNPSNRSYVCGFGNNPPTKPHHRGAHGSWNNQINNPVESRHTLYGALVGGPGNTDAYTDARDNYTTNEVACDYNAGFTGALARMYELYGGYTDPSFPQAETPDPQFFVEASINSSASNYTEIRALLNNRSAFPARSSSALRYRYFVDLTELYAAGGSKTNVTITTNMLDGGTISALLPWNEAAHVYYVELRYDGANIVPGGSTSYRREAQFRLAIPTSFGATAWNPSNDWSYSGLLAGNNNVQRSTKIPTYENGVLLEGTEAPRPTAWDNWKATHFTPTQMATPATAGPLDIPLHDGMANLLKYALGGTPWTPASQLVPALDHVGGRLVITFSRNAAATDTTLTVQASNHLTGSWTDIARSVNGGAMTALLSGVEASETGTGTEREVLVRDQTAAETARFMRLKATGP